MGTCADRSAEYLNWRFLQHPQRRYHLLTARRKGRLCGYLIYDWSGEDGTVVDLLAEEDQVCKELLIETIAIMRRYGVILERSAPCSHGGREIFEYCGFQPRESTPAIVLALPWAANHRVRSGCRWVVSNARRQRKLASRAKEWIRRQ